MRVDYAFICDYAEAGGKVNALGIGFDKVTAEQVPYKHKHFSLVLQLRASAVEAGQHGIQVHLIDEDGADLIPVLKSKVNIPRPESGTYSLGRFVIEFGNVEFKRYGGHSVRVTVDQMEVACLDFEVTTPPPKE